VKRNGGSPGIDGRTVAELPQYLIAHWNEIRESLLNGTYRPQPVKRVEIAKPNGGTRLLGIPTVVDRFVQQAMLQVLQRTWEPRFSEHSHGFRPGRSAHHAVAEAQQYIAEGYRWVVDLDLEKFFDGVNHDRLMSRVAEQVSDKRALKLIRRLLKSGVMIGGLITPTEAGTPQGGPLSPLLSNIVLDELDQELERRGHRFVRYADDCNVYVRSERAGRRVMESLRRFIAGKLRLRINETKSAVAQPWTRKFLGFSFTNRIEPARRIAPESLMRFKRRVRDLTRPTRGKSMRGIVAELNTYLSGWIGYFGFAQTKSVIGTLNKWIRRRLRSLIWRQWRTWKQRSNQLRQLGIDEPTACRVAATRRGSWATSNSRTLQQALSNSYFTKLGLIELRAT
jgi:RNA-directed DNA polymerase